MIKMVNFVLCIFFFTTVFKRQADIWWAWCALTSSCRLSTHTWSSASLCGGLAFGKETPGPLIRWHRFTEKSLLCSLKDDSTHLLNPLRCCLRPHQASATLLVKVTVTSTWPHPRATFCLSLSQPVSWTQMNPFLKYALLSVSRLP